MVSFFIWKGLIVLKGVPKDPRRVFGYNEQQQEFITSFCKWNDKFQGHLLSFGLQNLKRIKNLFPEAYPTKGQDRIEQLKQDFITYKDDKNIIAEISAGLLDKYPVEYSKLGPLGEYQDKAVRILTYARRVAVFIDCGLGKTMISLTSSENQINKGLVKRGKILVLGKLATLETGWMEDIEKFTNLKGAVLWLATSYKRKEKLLDILNNSGADIFVMNHEGVHVLKDALKAHKFERIIIDESTILKSFTGPESKMKGGKFGKALWEISEHAKYRSVMTGTPAPNGPHDMWGQILYVDPMGHTIESSIHDFRNMYMQQIFFGKPPLDEFGDIDKELAKSVPSTWKAKPELIPEVRAKIAPIVFRAAMKDHLKDMPDLTISVRTCHMDPDQTQHYIEMKENLCTEIDLEVVGVTEALASLQKLRQVTGGFLIDQEENVHEIEGNPKMSLMDDLVFDEIGLDNKIVIYAQYQWEITQLVSRYKEYGAVSVYGGNKASTNLENIRKFREDPDVKLIILHPRSAAHGITFTCAHYMIFYSISYSAEENYQCIKRIERAGQKHPMFVYYAIALSHKGEEVIDGIMYDVVKHKLRNQDALLSTEEEMRETVERIRAKHGSKRKGKSVS